MNGVNQLVIRVWVTDFAAIVCVQLRAMYLAYILIKVYEVEELSIEEIDTIKKYPYN